jgi:peptidoglycan/LPS O-acetylase OafA/YrhL
LIMKYRPDIDGLRCLAIVPVALFHAGADYFSGGFVGVDVFFVISGFLITSIIRQEIHQNTFTVAGFYERRCRRIFPPLIVVVLACFVIGYFTMLPGQYADFGSSAIAALLFVSNGFFWLQTGYFRPVAEWMPLLHTWSIAVEEQYYIIFPVFMLIARRWRVSRQLVVIGIVFALSFLISAYGAYRHPSAAFYLTPSRAWELLLGVLIAYWTSPTLRQRWLREALSFAGLLMILGPIAAYDARTPFPGLAAAVPCLGTGILIVTGRTGPGFVKSALENRVLVFIGLISYSLYLWHWPLFVFMRLRFAQTELSPGQVAAGTLLSFCISVLSWHFIERPFRQREAFSRGSIFRYSAAAVLLSLSIAGAVRLFDGIPDRVAPQALAFEEASKDIDPFGARCSGRVDDPSCHFGSDDSAPVSFVLWGDSHAAAFRPALEEAMKGSGRRGTLAWLDGGCPPLLGSRRVNELGAEECRAFRERVVAFLTDTDNSIKTVFLSARWLSYATGVIPEADDSHVYLIEDDQSEELGPEENRRVFNRSLQGTIDHLRAAHKAVVIVGGVPEVGWDVPTILALSAQHQVGLPQPRSRSETEEKYAFVDRVLSEMAEQDGVTYVPVWSLLCPEHCLIIEDNQAIYSDAHHLSLYGARRFLGPALKKTFEASGISVMDN